MLDVFQKLPHLTKVRNLYTAIVFFILVFSGFGMAFIQRGNETSALIVVTLIALVCAVTLLVAVLDPVILEGLESRKYHDTIKELKYQNSKIAGERDNLDKVNTDFQRKISALTSELEKFRSDEIKVIGVLGSGEKTMDEIQTEADFIMSPKGNLLRAIGSLVEKRKVEKRARPSSYRLVSKSREG